MLVRKIVYFIGVGNMSFHRCRKKVSFLWESEKSVFFIGVGKSVYFIGVGKNVVFILSSEM